ncbi:hypothetical protein [Stackebrandtia nassauensis]|uniref:Uncharacterized protein n=1 Tax=Stackebrandtia nassauensis (strain DSM 44728 / CIP 108903 / NRRL B-16338 / NBRC 102104 / LLR-40K-21) TaxID=446470 RepID=D3Q725_STANL|nr:hypothetical protein [Stackebrandtia nassauensis]ADD40424.1 hypothetical protein Snas_0711 [Stackebrandtia nassauensis DSM 44728]
MTDEVTPNPAPHPLTTEAAKKAQIAWIGVGSAPAACLWCLWIDDALHLVCGPGEQPDPGLDTADECHVTLRGDHNGRIVDFTATVARLDPADDSWSETATALAAKRLNATDGDTVERWRTECALYRLAPKPDEAPLSGAALPSASLAATVVPSPAARPTRKPFRLHRVKRRKR